MTWAHKIPCRMANEILDSMSKVHADAKYIPPHLRLLIVHAERDTIVEPAVSHSKKYVFTFSKSD